MPKILVMEDEDNILKMVRTNLTASGYQVVCAGTGEDWLQLAVAEKPDMILLDIKMPGLSGWDVLQTLRTDTRLKHIPVIVITAILKESDSPRVFAAGAQALLTKPFSIEQLLTEVAQILKRRVNNNAPPENPHRG